MAKEKIPEISDERLEELCEKIKPVVDNSRRHDKVQLWYIKAVDPRDMSFLWDPKPTKRARGLRKYKEIVTLHSYGAPVLFKPSIAEVLSQIPEKDIDNVAAFETEHLGFSEGSNYHTAVTILYTRNKRKK